MIYNVTGKLKESQPGGDKRKRGTTEWKNGKLRGLWQRHRRIVTPQADKIENCLSEQERKNVRKDKKTWPLQSICVFLQERHAQEVRRNKELREEVTAWEAPTGSTSHPSDPQPPPPTPRNTPLPTSFPHVPTFPPPCHTPPYYYETTTAWDTTPRQWEVQMGLGVDKKKQKQKWFKKKKD